MPRLVATVNESTRDPIARLAEHLCTCRGVQGAIVMQAGSADPVIAGPLAAGWTWAGGTEAASTENVIGKRQCYLTPPS